MATGVNVKMGVTGVQQFKQNMNTAKNSVKTLDQALALNEKQFKATGNAEDYMKQKTELLQVKLKEQKSIVSQAQKALEQMKKNGVDKASASFQTMQQQLLKAQGELIDTETELKNIGTDAKDAKTGVDGMNKELQKIGKGVSFEIVTSGIDSITSGLEKAAKAAVNLGTKLVTSVLGSGSTADDILTAADYFGMTPEEYQRALKTSALIDTDVDTIVRSRQKLATVIGKGTGNDVFEALGISTEGRNNDVEGIFWDVGDALMNMTDDVERETYAQQLLGKSWRELIPLFSAGRQKYEQVNSSWSVATDEQLQSLGAMDDEYQRLQGEWETFQLQMTSALSGPMTQILEVLSGLMEQFNTYLQSEDGQRMLEAIGEAVSGLITDLSTIDPEQVMQGLKDVLDKLIGALKWLADPGNQQTVIGGLKAIVGGWALLKLGGGALKLLELVNGLKWLGGNPKINIPGTEGGGGSGGIGGGIGSGLLGSVKGFVSGGGGASMLTPLAVLAAAVTPALIANQADYNREQERSARMEESATLLQGEMGQFLHNANQAYGYQENGQWGDMGDTYDILMGMKDRSDLEKAKLANMLLGQSSGGNDAWMELQRLWNGEEFDSMRLNDLMSTVMGSYDRMARVQDQNAQNTQDIARNSITSSDISSFRGLPAAMAAAVENGMSNVKIYIDGYYAGQALTPHINSAMGGLLAGISR